MSAHGKPTAVSPGPWTVETGRRATRLRVVDPQGLVIAIIDSASANTVEAESDANLIAEAGTVHHETGMTPRQLAESYAERGVALDAARAANDELRAERNRLAERCAALEKDAASFNTQRDALLNALVTILPDAESADVGGPDIGARLSMARAAIRLAALSETTEGGQS